MSATDGGGNWTSGTKRVEHEDVVITDDCEVVDVTRVHYQRYAAKTGFCPFCQSEEGVEFVDEVGPGGTYRKQRFECECGAFGEGLWTWKAGLKEGRPSREDSERVATNGDTTTNSSEHRVVQHFERGLQILECRDCGDRGISHNDFEGEDCDGDTDTDREDRTDGGHVRTSDADLAAHDHANELEAALDYVMAATRRARNGSVSDGAVARLQLAECGTRLAFFATTDETRTVGIRDATEHLEAAVERIDEDSVTHPARHALQLFAGYHNGE